MAHAEAMTATEPQPSTSAMVQAKVPQTTAGTEMALAAAASVLPAGVPSHAVIHQVVQTNMTENLLLGAIQKPGTLEFAMSGSIPTESSAPKVTRAVEMALTPQDMAEQPAVSSVVLRAIVDENGVPRNVAVTRSAGSAIDRRAVEAVSQYRFKPATIDNKPTWATVSISIKIQK
jgi:TonB family protein